MKGVEQIMTGSPETAGKAQLDRWIKAIGQGDRDALEMLYCATSSAVFAYAFSILKNPHDAEDVLHDCFVSIWNCARDYQSQGKPMAWIMILTRNLCYKLLRQQRRTLSMETEYAFSRQDTDPEDALMLRACMNALSDEERQIVVLHAVAGVRHRQIADLLGLKTSTVLSKYHRAIRKLRARL